MAEEAVNGGTSSLDRSRQKKLDIAILDLVEWTLTDHLNTVRDIAKYDPKTAATTVVNHFSSDTSVHLLYGARNHLIYDAFGRVTSETNPAESRKRRD